MAQTPAHDVRIVVGSSKYELTNWVAYDIESSLLTPADAFSFTISNPQGRHSADVSKFDPVQVLVDGTVQMDGYVDGIRLQSSPDSGSTMEIVGRDRFGQLVDVSADPQTIRNLDLGQIAAKLGAPFVTQWEYDNESNRQRLLVARARAGRYQPLNAKQKKDRLINALVKILLPPDQRTAANIARAPAKEAAVRRALIKADASRAKSLAAAKANLAKIRAEVFPTIKVEPGDSPMSVIVKAAQRSELLVWLAADGRGIIARPNYDQPALFSLWHYPLTSTDRRFNNVRDIAWALDGSKQFAEYRIAGHGQNTAVTFGTGSFHEVSLQDSGVPLSRKKIVRGTAKNRKRAKIQLERKIQRVNFNALTGVIDVRGHGQNGLLWQVDTLCAITDAVNGQQGDFYVSKRRFVGDESGQRTELEVHPPRVLLP